MKKKLMSLILCCCLVLAPASVWADSSIVYAQPRWSHVNVIHTSVGINSSGVATMYVAVDENPNNPFTYSKLTVYIKRASDDSTVKTFTATKYPDVDGFFYWDKSYQLTKRGTYYIKATNKIYKNGTLKETIHTVSTNDTY